MNSVINNDVRKINFNVNCFMQDEIEMKLFVEELIKQFI